MDILRISRVIKVGGSYAVIIPANVTHQLELQRGDQLAVAVYEEGSLVLRKLSAAELLQIKPPFIKHG